MLPAGFATTHGDLTDRVSDLHNQTGHALHLFGEPVPFGQNALVLRPHAAICFERLLGLDPPGELLPGFVQTIPHRPNARRTPSSRCGMVGYSKALLASRAIRVRAVISFLRATVSAVKPPCFSAFLLPLGAPPPAPCADVAHDRLPAFGDVDVLNDHALFALPSRRSGGGF